MVRVPDGYKLEKEIGSWKGDLRNSGSVQMSEAGWPGVRPGTRRICQK